MNLNESYNQIDPHASHAQAFELGWNAALENQWQPIESHPVDDSYFLAQEEDGAVFSCYAMEDGNLEFSGDGHVKTRKIILWMPIPKPPVKK